MLKCVHSYEYVQWNVCWLGTSIIQGIRVPGTYTPEVSIPRLLLEREIKLIIMAGGELLSIVSTVYSVVT